MTRLAIAALVVATLSCASHEPLTFRFDADIDASTQALIESAAKPWNERTFEDRRITFAPDGAWRISVTDDLEAQAVGRTCKHAGGFDCALPQWIRIRPGHGEERTYGVAMHEFGHALGVAHLDEGRVGVMSANVLTTTFSDDDRTACVVAGACPMITVRPEYP